MADPDLQINGGEGGYPDPEIRGRGQSHKNIFQPFGPQSGLKIRVGGGGGGGRVSPLDPPLPLQDGQ